MKRFVLQIFLLIGFCTICSASEVPFATSVLRYAQNHLPLSGKLKQSDGFVYVDVDDAYIYRLIDFIREEGFEEPPYFGPGLVGAHISVFYPQEVRAWHIQEIEESGALIHFSVEACQIIHPSRWQEVDAIYLIVVEAPELEGLREKYGLPKEQYPFHITIGIKPKIAESA